MKKTIAIVATALLIAAVGTLPARSARAHYPQILPIPDLYLTVNQQGPVMRFSIADRETPVDSLELTSSSDNPQLVPNDDAHIELSGSGQDRAVVITPAEGQAGMATISITLIDGDGESATTQFRVFVRPPANR